MKSMSKNIRRQGGKNLESKRHSKERAGVRQMRDQERKEGTSKETRKGNKW